MLTPKIINSSNTPAIIQLTGGKLVLQTNSATPQICIQTGPEGPQGPQGPGGDAPTLGVLLSGETPLSGHRAVVLVPGIGMRYADPLSDNDAGAQVGLLLQATSPGNVGNVQFSGLREEPSWSWINGPIFLGLDGVLTQTPISHGWILMIARAIGPTKIIIDPETPFWRE